MKNCRRRWFQRFRPRLRDCPSNSSNSGGNPSSPADPDTLPLDGAQSKPSTNSGGGSGGSRGPLKSAFPRGGEDGRRRLAVAISGGDPSPKSSAPETLTLDGGRKSHPNPGRGKRSNSGSDFLGRLEKVEDAIVKLEAAMEALKADAKKNKRREWIWRFVSCGSSALKEIAESV